MNNIVYTYGNKIYLNITNACPCDCEFCVRNNTDGLGDMGSLWLSKEPSVQEIISAIDAFDFTGYSDVVFCGFGEPTCALKKLIEAAKHIRKTKKGVTIRLNTNGLSDLINKKKDSAAELEGLIDAVSVSLNASDAEKYERIVHPSFGKKSFDAMISFTKNCKKYIPSVKMTVVDTIGEEEIKKCQALCDANSIELRVRKYIK